MARGPSISLEQIAKHQHDLQDGLPNIGFRVLVAYEYRFDIRVLRLDVKIDDEQFCVAVPCGEPVKNTGKITAKGDLMTPSDGVVSCQNVKVPKEMFIAALKELVHDLETHVSLRPLVKNIYKPADGKTEWAS